MGEITSTAFVEWNAYLDEAEWKQHTKQDHQLALIAYEVHLLTHLVRQAFGDKSARADKMPSFDEFLLKFRHGDEPEEEPVEYCRIDDAKIDETKIVRPEHKDSFEHGYGLPGIDLEKDEPDEKWLAVAAKAKERWFAYLPKDCIVGYEPGVGDDSNGEFTQRGVGPRT